MLQHPEVQLSLTRALVDDMIAEAREEALAREARQAAPNFVPPSRARDTAFWAIVIGPVAGLVFLGYFAQAIGRAVIQ